MAIGTRDGDWMGRITAAFGWFARALMLACGFAALAGCSTLFGPAVKTGHVTSATLERMEALGMDRKAPILIRIFKTEGSLEMWKRTRAGRYALLKTFPICKFSGGLGPKLAEGDRQAPEGFYEVTAEQLNPFSREYLSFNTGFPNAYDRSLGRTGSDLMVHGGCRSVGCYAMTNAGIDEIYGLVYEAFQGGQQRIQLQALPFHLTHDTLALHAQDANAAFWSNLKEGSDAFLATKRPPKVAVCGQRYVFDAPAGTTLDPTAPCPPAIQAAFAALHDEAAPGSSVSILPH